MSEALNFDRANQLGTCACPICKAPGADVCKGKRFPYVVCESCGSLCQTRARRGGQAILEMMKPAPEPEPKPAPPAPAPKRKGALDVLTGGSDG